MNRTLVQLLALFFLSLSAFPLVGNEYDQMKGQAENFYAEKSFSKSLEIYEKVDLTTLPPEQKKWVTFRKADSRWREHKTSGEKDRTALDTSLTELQQLVLLDQHAINKDVVWAEIHESLGDFYWIHEDARNWHEAWKFYSVAMDFWAGASDLELARTRYLRLAKRIAAPPMRANRHYYYGYYGNTLPLAFIEDLQKIVQKKEDVAWAHYLMAMTLRQQGGDAALLQRVGEEFKKSLEAGQTGWYHEALFHYAEWSLTQGAPHYSPEGVLEFRPDHKKALELYRRLRSEFKEGQTQYYQQAKARIDEITNPNIHINVPNFFKPGAIPEFFLTCRNVEKIDFTLYQLDPQKDVSFGKNENENWINQIRTDSLKAVKSWSHKPATQEYRPVSERKDLNEPLTPGLYLLVGSSGTFSGRDIIMVSDLSVVVKTVGNKGLVFVCEAVSGAPVKNAQIQISTQWRTSENKVQVETITGRSNDSGLFPYSSNKKTYEQQLIVASIGDRVSLSLSNMQFYNVTQNDWKVFAYTDRPSYRPTEKISWKFFVRNGVEGSYKTPANQKIKYQIRDPQGNYIKEETTTLNAFGSAWGTVETTATSPLGEYLINFQILDQPDGYANSTTLFRLEEYKLPEYKITVSTPEENGKKKTYRVGETVEAKINAEYYFGGAVPNACLLYTSPSPRD